MAPAGLWAGPLGALAGIVAAAAAVWALVPRPEKVPVPPEPEVPEWVVGPARGTGGGGEGAGDGRPGTVGITTGLYGAGGFGKTTLARMVCADRRVQAAVRGAGVPGDGGPGCAGRGGGRGQGQ